MLKKVISGGQTGMDQAGIFEARKAGIRTGGTAPKGWMTEVGPAPWLADYGLVECTVRGYPARTYENAKNSDATVVFREVRSAGCHSTIGYCRTLQKPYIVNPTAEELIYYIWNQKVEVLNVAGNSRTKLTEAKFNEFTQILTDVFTFFAKNFFQQSR